MKDGFPEGKQKRAREACPLFEFSCFRLIGSARGISRGSPMSFGLNGGGYEIGARQPSKTGQKKEKEKKERRRKETERKPRATPPHNSSFRLRHTSLISVADGIRKE